jgi:hypothetical protein
MKITPYLLMSPTLWISSCKTWNPVGDVGILPDGFFPDLRTDTKDKHWERVYGMEAHMIARQAKERHYDPNGLWTEWLKECEAGDKLLVYVFVSKNHVAVVWFCPEKEIRAGWPSYHIRYEAICYSSQTGDVVTIGTGGTSLGDIFKTVDGGSPTREGGICE